MAGKQTKKAARRSADDEAEELLAAYRAAVVRHRCTIGPERDALTRALAARGAKLHAIEAILKKREPGLRVSDLGIRQHLERRCSCAR